MKKYWILFAVFFTLLLSCTQKPTGPHLKRLRFRRAAQTPTIDSSAAGDGTSRDVIVTLHTGLLHMDQNNKLVPELAESWELAPDRKTYTFKLRPALKWSDGKALVAQDFVYAVERALTPKTAALSANFLLPIEKAQDFFSGKINDFSQVGAKALDERTLQIKLANPTPYWINIAAYPILFPLRRDVIEKYGDRWTDAGHYVGAGPYVLKEKSPQGRILCAKNPNYWNQETLKGSFDEIEWSLIEEGNSAVTLYQKGDIDIVERVPFEQVSMLAKSEPGFKSFPTLFVVSVGFSFKNADTKNVDVRRALAMALDRDQMKKFLPSDSKPAASWLPEELLPASEKTTIAFDPAAAKKLWASIKNPPKKLEYYMPATSKAKITAEYIQQQWKQNLGLDIEVNAQEWKVFLKSQQNQDLALFYTGWIADFPDAINFLELYVCQSGQNYGHFCDPHYDERLKKTYGLTDDQARYKVYADAEKELLQKNVVLLPLTREYLSYLVNPKLTGFAVNGMGEYRLADVKLKSD